MAEELLSAVSVIWDVGANVGIFGFCAGVLSGVSGFVLSIESDLWLAHLMTRSRQALLRKGCSEVEELCASVSDSNRVSRLEIAERARASNHLIGEIGSTQAKLHARSPVERFADTGFFPGLFSVPSILTIDIERHEVSVLRGTARLLREVRPII